MKKILVIASLAVMMLCLMSCNNQKKEQAAKADIYKNYETYSFNGNFTYKVPHDLEEKSIEDDMHTFATEQDDGTQLVLMVTYTKDIGGSIITNDKVWEKVKQQQLEGLDSSIDKESIDSSVIKVNGKKAREITWQQEFNSKIYYAHCVCFDCNDGLAAFALMSSKENQYEKTFNNIVSSIDIES